MKYFNWNVKDLKNRRNSQSYRAMLRRRAKAFAEHKRKEASRGR